MDTTTKALWAAALVLFGFVFGIAYQANNIAAVSRQAQILAERIDDLDRQNRKLQDALHAAKDTAMAGREAHPIFNALPPEAKMLERAPQ